MSRIMRLGGVDGIVRLRTVKAGYNAADDTLDARYVTFDSTWENSLRLLGNGVVSSASLSTRTVTYNYFPGVPAGTRTARVLPFSGDNSMRPVLAWQRRGAGTIQYTPSGWPLGNFPLPAPTAYQRAYGVCAATLRNNEILLSPSKSGVDYVYFVFGNDGSGPEIGGANSGRIGNHPTYGPGLYIARPGYDRLTASLDDMMLTTRRNHFQFAETGIAFPDRYTGGGAFNPTSSISSDPNPEFFGAKPSQTRNAKLVTTTGSYPHYPPVVAFSTDTGFQHQLSVFWLNASQFIIAGTPNALVGMRWGVVATDPTYQGGTDTVHTRRIRMSPDGGIDISKHDVDVLSAGQTDFIFRSRHLTPRFSGFASVLSTAPSADYSLASTPGAGAGIPFVFYIFDDTFAGSGGGRWCGCGMVQMQDIFTTGGPTPPYMPTQFRAATISRTAYRWYRQSGISVAPYGSVATMNVSDFT